MVLFPADRRRAAGRSSCASSTAPARPIRTAGRITAPACRYDREDWERVDTAYEGGVLTIRVTPPSNSVWFAYFAPYTMERHHDLVASVAGHPGVEYRSLGQTLDGQEIDYFRIGERAAAGLALRPPASRRDDGRMVDGRRARAAARRCRPGRPPAAREGDLPRRPQHESRTARAAAICGPTRSAPTSTANGTSRAPRRSPEVLCVRNEMDRTGVDFAMDVHGDEAIAANFLAGFEGIPSWKRGAAGAVRRASPRRWSASRPISRPRKGYEIAKPGQANHVDVDRPARRALRRGLDDPGNAVQGQ